MVNFRFDTHRKEERRSGKRISMLTGEEKRNATVNELLDKQATLWTIMEITTNTQ